jgi:hypothetical protein
MQVLYGEVDLFDPGCLQQTNAAAYASQQTLRVDRR